MNRSSSSTRGDGANQRYALIARPRRDEEKRRGEIAESAGLMRSVAVQQPYPEPTHTATSGAENPDAATSPRSPPGKDRTESPRPLPRDGCANRAPVGAYPLPARKPTAPANLVSESPYRSRSSRCRSAVPACDLRADAGSGAAPGESRAPAPPPATRLQLRRPLAASLPVVELGVLAPRYQGVCDISCKENWWFCTAPSCRNRNAQLRVYPR